MRICRDCGAPSLDTGCPNCGGKNFIEADEAVDALLGMCEAVNETVEKW